MSLPQYKCAQVVDHKTNERDQRVMLHFSMRLHLGCDFKPQYIGPCINYQINHNPNSTSIIRVQLSRMLSSGCKSSRMLQWEPLLNNFLEHTKNMAKAFCSSSFVKISNKFKYPKQVPFIAFENPKLTTQSFPLFSFHKTAFSLGYFLAPKSTLKDKGLDVRHKCMKTTMVENISRYQFISALPAMIHRCVTILKQAFKKLHHIEKYRLLRIGCNNRNAKKNGDRERERLNTFISYAHSVLIGLILKRFPYLNEWVEMPIPKFRKGFKHFPFW